jgi:predicted solute-binding protein
MRMELQRISRSLMIQQGPPVVVNRWLSEGKVVAAPCSSICLLRNSRHEFAAPLGVASTGTVQSVYLGYQESHRETIEGIKRQHTALAALFHQVKQAYHNESRGIARALWHFREELPRWEGEVPSIRMSPASASSVTLAKIFYRMWFGDAAFEHLLREEQGISRVTINPPLELVIGDEALVRRCSFAGVLDLGQMWRDFTGLPFVFAVWQSLGAMPSGVRQLLSEAASLAQARMKVEPSIYLPDIDVKDDHSAAIDLRAYWRVIDYQLGGDEIRGLLLFLCIAGYFIADAMTEDALVKIMRWQEMGYSGSYGH